MMWPEDRTCISLARGVHVRVHPEGKITFIGVIYKDKF